MRDEPEKLDLYEVLAKYVGVGERHTILVQPSND